MNGSMPNAESKVVIDGRSIPEIAAEIARLKVDLNTLMALKPEIVWLLDEAYTNLGSVHGEMCISDGPSHCCTLDRLRMDRLAAALEKATEFQEAEQ